MLDKCTTNESYQQNGYDSLDGEWLTSIKLSGKGYLWSNKSCHRCSSIGSRPYQGLFLCPSCSLRYNADLNGAINIAKLALEQSSGAGAPLTEPRTRARPENPTPFRGGSVNLTSSPNSKRRIQDSWRVLKEQLRRRGLLNGFFWVRELTQSGLAYMHLIIHGSFIPQQLLSKWWGEIHQAPVVDIRLVRFTRKAVANYISKYVSKDLKFRWTCSWDWVWKGFCRSWEKLKRLAKAYDCSRNWLLSIWRIHCHMGIPP